MPNNFLPTWLRKKLPGASQQDPNTPPKGMPRLPVPRPRPITPPASSSAADPRFDTRPAVAASPFFQRLPAELRRATLIEAFGARRLHAHFEHAHPLRTDLVRREGKRPRRRRRHCDLPTAPEPGSAVRDRAHPKEFCWFGCECHREPPGGTTRRLRGRVEEVRVPPWMDGCVEGSAACCED